MISPEAKEVKLPTTIPNYFDTYIAFPDCPQCSGRGYHEYRRNDYSRARYQCGECEWRNYQWKRTFPIVYRLARKPWYTAEEPVWNKKLEKMEWRKVRHHAETTTVYAAVIINGVLEPIHVRWWKDTSVKDWNIEFGTIEKAQQWIAEQEQGNISDFWVRAQ